nr:stress response protein nst1-like isoform X2 [Oncorhynchus nerka]
MGQKFMDRKTCDEHQNDDPKEAFASPDDDSKCGTTLTFPPPSADKKQQRRQKHKPNIPSVKHNTNTSELSTQGQLEPPSLHLLSALDGRERRERSRRREQQERRERREQREKERREDQEREAQSSHHREQKQTVSRRSRQVVSLPHNHSSSHSSQVLPGGVPVGQRTAQVSGGLGCVEGDVGGKEKGEGDIYSDIDTDLSESERLPLPSSPSSPPNLDLRPEVIFPHDFQPDLPGPEATPLVCSATQIPPSTLQLLEPPAAGCVSPPRGKTPPPLQTCRHGAGQVPGAATAAGVAPDPDGSGGEWECVLCSNQSLLFPPWCTLPPRETQLSQMHPPVPESFPFYFSSSLFSLCPAVWLHTLPRSLPALYWGLPLTHPLPASTPSLTTGAVSPLPKRSYSESRVHSAEKASGRQSCGSPAVGIGHLKRMQAFGNIRNPVAVSPTRGRGHHL